MANVFLALPVPAGDGVGAWVDTSGVAPGKTVTVDGGAFAGTLILELSNDAQASAVPVPVQPFTGPTQAPVEFEAPAQFMRVRRSGSTIGTLGAPTVAIAGEGSTTNIFGAMAVPAGDGVGALIDLSGGGAINAFSVAGGDPRSQIIIEISTDGANFSGALVFTGGGGVPQIFEGVVSAARVRRRFTQPGGAAILVAAGSGGSSGGGGVFPGFGGAPPAVASASAAGAAGTASRSNHTHALDLVAYNPSLAGMQAGGVIQQTYAAPTATPSVLTMVAPQIPFGAAGGVLTQSSRLSFTDAATCALVISTTTNAQINLSNTVSANGNNINFQFAGVNWGQIRGAQTTGVHNSLQISTAVVAGGDGYDRMQMTSLAFPTAPLFVVMAAFSDAALGSTDPLAAAATAGFVWLPQIQGAPTGVPAILANGVQANATVRLRQPTVIDSVNHRWYWYDTTGAAWHFAQFADFAPTYNSVSSAAASGLSLLGQNASSFFSQTSTVDLRSNAAGVLGVNSAELILQIDGSIQTFCNVFGGGVGTTLAQAIAPWGDAFSLNYTVVAGGATQATLGVGGVIMSSAATQQIGKSGGSLFIQTTDANDVVFRVNSVEALRVDSASTRVKVAAAGLVAPNAVAVAITNAPAGVAAAPAEYWAVLGTGGAVRYVPLLG